MKKKSTVIFIAVILFLMLGGGRIKMFVVEEILAPYTMNSLTDTFLGGKALTISSSSIDSIWKTEMKMVLLIPRKVSPQSLKSLEIHLCKDTSLYKCNHIFALVSGDNQNVKKMMARYNIPVAQFARQDNFFILDKKYTSLVAAHIEVSRKKNEKYKYNSYQIRKQTIFAASPE